MRQPPPSDAASLVVADPPPHLRIGDDQQLLVPRCRSCRRLHRTDLPCWRGKYAQRMTSHVLTTQGRRCWICGGYAHTADHVTARSLGGDDRDENLRPACGPCNYGRGNRPNPFPDPEEVSIPPESLSPRWRTDEGD